MGGGGCKSQEEVGYWKLRNLTLEGKVLIVKAVILPVLLYTSMIFPPAKQHGLCSQEGAVPVLLGIEMGEIEKGDCG